MKKTLLFISAMVAGVASFGQTVPNWNFEAWTSSTKAVSWSNTLGIHTSGAFTFNTSAPMVDSSGGHKLGTSSIQIHSAVVNGKNAPGLTISGNNASADLNLVLNGSFQVVSSSQSFYGSFAASTAPKALSGFARFRTMKDSIVKASVTIQLFAGANVVGGYQNPNAVGSADSVSFLIDTVAMSSGFVNFNVPITSSTSSIDSIRIVFSTAIPSLGTKATAADTLWVDGLRFLSCQPDPAVTLANAGITSDNGSTGISADGVLSLPSSSAGAAYNHTFTISTPDPAYLSQMGYTFTASPVDSNVYDAISNLPVGLTYTAGEPSGTVYGNSIYCFSVSGTLPAAGTTNKYLIKQTPYGTLSYPAINLGGFSVPAGSTSMPNATIGGFPRDLSHTTVDSIMINIAAGSGGPIGVATLDASTFGVAQNVPNPFSGSTTIAFNTPNAGNVTFTVTDVLGRTVSSQTISASAGVNTITYAAGDSGTYFYTLSNGSTSITKKFVVSK